MNTYDNEGNLIQVDQPGDIHVTYGYDVRNRLITVFVWNGPIGGTLAKNIHYTYDAFDRRVAKWVDPDGYTGSAPIVTEIYADDGDDLLLTRSATGAATHRYLNGPLVDQVLADDKLVTSPGVASAVRWLLADEQQTTRKLLQAGASPTTVAEFTYNSFGKLTSGTTPAAVDLLFGHAGGQYDGETGLIQRDRRYYDPNTGRFLTEDPAEADINPYRYAGNDPINYVDPSGLMRGGNSSSLGGYTGSSGVSSVDLLGGRDQPNINYAYDLLRNPPQKFVPEPPKAPGRAPVLGVDIPLTKFDPYDRAAVAAANHQDWVDRHFPQGSPSRAFRDRLEIGPEVMFDGFGNRIKEAGYMVHDIAAGFVETKLRDVSNFTGWFDAPRFEDWSNTALSNPVNSPDFGWNAVKNAGRAGFAGFSAGGSEIGLATWEYAHTGDDIAFQQNLGGVVGTNLTAVGMIKAPSYFGGRSATTAPRSVSRQTFATGSEWYEYYAGKYGAQNVDWVSGSGRTITWDPALPLPPEGIGARMFRVPPERGSASRFAAELESVAGVRPASGIAHHNQPLGLNGVDSGTVNGSWQINPVHQNWHNIINRQVNQLPYGTEIRIKPGGN